MQKFSSLLTINEASDNDKLAKLKKLSNDLSNGLVMVRHGQTSGYAEIEITGTVDGSELMQLGKKFSVSSITALPKKKVKIVVKL